MDGNGRWAKKKGLLRNLGHQGGAKTVREIVEVCAEINVKYLTLYAFSTENWKRPQKEIDFLFNLLEGFLNHKLNNLIEKNIRLKFIGQLNKLSLKLKKLIKLSEKKTSENSSIQVNVALNYGSKNELINSIRLINKKKINVSEKNINMNLFTRKMPNPDILIRTGNTQRSVSYTHLTLPTNREV